MARVLALYVGCLSLARQEITKAQAWLELVTSLKIVFKLELKLVGKPKSLNLAWLGLIRLISQAKFKLNIKLKLELKSNF